MSFISQAVQWVTARYEPFSAPALDRMRLGPEDSPNNPLMIQFFTWDCKHPDMSWWAHFASEIPWLATMGFTQIWLPPANKATNKDGRGYDAYDLWDLGEFDQKGTIETRWGTRQELLYACRLAKRHRMDILIDAVLNHKMGADRSEAFLAVPVDPVNRLREVGKVREIEGWAAFDFLGRGGKYSAFRWTHEHFTGVDWDQRTKTSGVFRIVSDNHQGWSPNVNQELGNYDYLLGVDIDHRHPEVRKDLFAWGKWVLETTGASGFRLDAIKHIDRKFLLDFITTVRQQLGKPTMFTVSEYWSPDVTMVLSYVRAFCGETAFFDVPLHDNFHHASKQGASYDLRTVFDNTLVKARPRDAVTFVDNHDTVVGQSLESWVGKSFKEQAYALILLREGGYPCVFYGDLYPNEEGFDKEVSETLNLLIQARKLFAYGPTRECFADPDSIGWSRLGNADHMGCVVVVSNAPVAGRYSPFIDVGQNNAGALFVNFLRPRQRVRISPSGWQRFPSQNTVHVWVKANERL